MITVVSPAKLIVLGEHGSLYGNPCLVLALDLYAKVRVQKREDSEVRITAPGLGLEDAPLKRREKGMALIDTALGIVGERGFDIEINSEIPLASGLGSSAAISAALLKALKAELEQESHTRLLPHAMQQGAREPFALRELAKEATICENAVHGKSSGVDPFAVVYGGAILYQNKTAEKLEAKELPSLVIAHSGEYSDTGDIVAYVDKIRTTDTKRFKEFIEGSKKAVRVGKDALLSSDWDTLGKAMIKNHELLKMMGASSEKLDDMVNVAKDTGALGAKLCGAGRGGVMAALVDKKSKGRVKEALSSMGAKIIEANPSKKGAMLK